MVDRGRWYLGQVVWWAGIVLMLCSPFDFSSSEYVLLGFGGGLVLNMVIRYLTHDKSAN